MATKVKPWRIGEAAVDWPISVPYLDQARPRKRFRPDRGRGSQGRPTRSALALDMQGLLPVNTRDNATARFQ